MRVAQIAVDEIVFAGDRPTVVATVFEFGENRQWITTHPGVEGERLGPVTVPTGATSLDTPTVRMTSLGVRELRTIRKKGRVQFSHRTDWTVDPDTLYAVVLPTDCVPSALSIESQNRGIRFFAWKNVRRSAVRLLAVPRA